MQNNTIKKLIKILEESNIDELEVSTFWGRQKIRIRKSYTKYDQNIEVHETISNKSTLEENINQNETFVTESNEVIQNENSNIVKEEESNIFMNIQREAKIAEKIRINKEKKNN